MLYEVEVAVQRANPRDPQDDAVIWMMVVDAESAEQARGIVAHCIEHQAEALGLGDIKDFRVLEVESVYAGAAAFFSRFASEKFENIKAPVL